MGAKRLWTIWAGAAAMAVAGCGTETSPTATGDGTGAIEIALAATANGTTYVLANATFTVAPLDPSSNTALVLHQADPTAGDITASVPVGRYTVALFDGWQLEREDSPTTLVPLDAELLSSNPMTVSVFNGQTSSVTFQFQTSGMPVAIGPGSGTIDIGVGVSTCDPGAPANADQNIIADPGFEGDAAGWSFFGNGTLSDDAHCGLHSLQALDAPAVEYRPPIGQLSGTYAASAWVRSDTSADVSFGFVDGSLNYCSARTTASVPAGTWFQMTGTVSTGTGCGDPVVFIIGAGGTPFLLDDVYLIPQ